MNSKQVNSDPPRNPLYLLVSDFFETIIETNKHVKTPEIQHFRGFFTPQDRLSRSVPNCGEIY